jgi:hypothetical protein
MKYTRKQANRTSFHGVVVEASVEQLFKILGSPRYDSNDGSDKVNFDWVLENEDGDVFTVYDWKEYRPLEEDEMIVWHIGGSSEAVTQKAVKEIVEALSKLEG